MNLDLRFIPHINMDWRQIIDLNVNIKLRNFKEKTLVVSKDFLDIAQKKIR